MLKSLRVRGGATPPPLRDYATKFEAPSSVSYAPIGVVRSPYVERHGTPRQATVGNDELGVIALNPEFRGSLKSLDGFDYVWVLAHMHLQTGKLRRFQIKPPRGDERHGVFATRARCRPSPISLSALRLIAVDEEKLELTVQGLDRMGRLCSTSSRMCHIATRSRTRGRAGSTSWTTNRTGGGTGPMTTTMAVS